MVCASYIGQRTLEASGVQPEAWQADWPIGSLRNNAMSKHIAASTEELLVATMVSTLIPPKVRLLRVMLLIWSNTDCP